MRKRKKERGEMVAWRKGIRQWEKKEYRVIGVVEVFFFFESNFVFKKKLLSIKNRCNKVTFYNTLLTVLAKI